MCGRIGSQLLETELLVLGDPFFSLENISKQVTVD